MAKDAIESSHPHRRRGRVSVADVGQGSEESFSGQVSGAADPATGASDYDANGNRTRLRATIDGTADFENVYEYDKINRLDDITQQSAGGNPVAPKRAVLIYDDASRLQNVVTFADVTAETMVNTTTYTHDPAGRLTYLSHFQFGTSNTIVYAWGYDRSNRITGYTRDDGSSQTESQTYNYDDAGQLTLSAGSLPAENYTYDGNGNRTNTGYDTPAGSDNRLATDGTYNYAYDAEGNLILRTEVAAPGNARVFDYDYRNRLTGVRDYTGYVDELNPGTLVMDASYTYDVNNLRIKKVVDADGDGPGAAVTTGFVYEGGHVVLQFDGAGTVTNRYLHGPAVDQVLADERSSGILWALSDNLGSVRDIVDSTGQVVNHVKYSAFGAVVSETAPGTNFLFGYTGAVFDIETSLGYHRARYLDHATGRWINQDPIGFAAGDANLYRYVGNEPTNATDPSGLAEIATSERVKWVPIHVQLQATTLPFLPGGWNVVEAKLSGISANGRTFDSVTKSHEVKKRSFFGSETDTSFETLSKGEGCNKVEGRELKVTVRWTAKNKLAHLPIIGWFVEPLTTPTKVTYEVKLTIWADGNSSEDYTRKEANIDVYRDPN